MSAKEWSIGDSGSAGIDPVNPGVISPFKFGGSTIIDGGHPIYGPVDGKIGGFDGWIAGGGETV